MARFDVHRLEHGGLVIDCQSDLLDQLNTRLVVPLMPQSSAPRPALRLNPTFSIVGEEHVMLTQFAAAIERREMGDPVASLADRMFEIIDALDVLISGV